MPAAQLQQLRQKLRGIARIYGAKKRLIKVAFEDAKKDKKDIDKLENYLDGMIGLIFTNENPFKLASRLRRNRTKAPAKPGQVAPHDIEVKAGPTPFAPGPIIGELGSLGIKTGVEDGKVAIKQDTTIVEEGQEINRKVAELLTRLDIKPMEIGLNLKAAYDDGVVFEKDILNVDESEYVDNLTNAARESYLLAVEVGYPTEDTIKPLIAKAYRESEGLALSQGIFIPALIKKLLARAERFASALAGKVS
jgi:large subunit ribosomal protein L10